MALTAADFADAFPEFLELFEEAPETITRALSAAEKFCDSGIWGDRYEDGVFYKAAHLLAMQPFGENARLSKQDNKTTYGEVFAEMKLALPIRMMTT